MVYAFPFHIYLCVVCVCVLCYVNYSQSKSCSIIHGIIYDIN